MESNCHSVRVEAFKFYQNITTETLLTLIFTMIKQRVWPMAVNIRLRAPLAWQHRKYHCRQWIQCYRPLAANNIPLPPVDPMIPTISYKQYTIATSGSNATDHWLPKIYNCRQWIQCYRPLTANNIPLPPVDPMLPTIGCQQYAIAASGSNVTDHTDSLQRGQNYQRRKVTYSIHA